MSVAEGISWPKDFQELKVIDGLLRCGICYEYLRTCLVTPCSHNYCSFCIRKSMQYKTQCPMCFKETFEVNLQTNRVLDEIVENFTSIRDKLIRHLRIAEIHLSVQQANHLNVLPAVNATPIKMKTEAGKTSSGKENTLKLKTPQTEKKKKDDSKGKSTPKTDSKKKNIFQRDNLVIRTVDDDDSDHDSDDCFISDKENELSSPQKIIKEKANGVVIPEIFLNVSPKKKVVEKNKEQEDVLTVPCPVCSVHIPERNINIHLDSCLYRSERPVRKQTKSANKRSPLPKLVYNMMSEKDLRKKLKEHGLAQNGDKKTLISRLQRFTVLYNSECDAIDPRPVSDIIQQIENEEKGEKKNQPTHRTVINRNTDPKIIEEENNKYIQENKNSFEALIKAVREREGRKPKEIIIDDGDDDEDGDNDSHDNKKVNITVIEEDSKHCVFNSDPSTSKAGMSDEKEDKQPIEVADESSDDEFSVPSIIPRFTPPKSLKIMTKSNTVVSGNRDGQNKGNVEVTTTLNKTENIPVNTQKLSDEELGLHSEVSSDVNSVYHASDNEDEVNSSDNESVSLLAKVNEENCIDELPNGNLSDEGESDIHKNFENENNTNSQLEDPDFVVNTQDLEDENSEEFFHPRHKTKITPAQGSKRKMVKAILSDSDDNGDDSGNVHNNHENVENLDTPRRSLRKRVKH